MPNGLRVITEEIPYVRSVSVGLWVGTGSRFEDENVYGISHFIEHLLFKGTTTRSARELAEAIDAVGGQLNAFTAKEYTCYYARVLDEHVGVAVDILADMMLHSRFETGDVAREKGVVIEEIKMYEDAPDELVHDLFAQALWQNHPLGRTILGTSETVSGLDREKILSYFRSHYTADNSVLAVAGNMKHEQVLEIAAAGFEEYGGHYSQPSLEAPTVSPKVVVRTKDTEQVHLCLGTRGVSQDDADVYPLHVLNSILGGGSSSRLFQEIRENRGLAYAVYSYQSSYRDAGLFTVYAGMSPACVEEVIGLILAEFHKVRRDGITRQELDRAREQVKGGLLLGLESTSNRMSRLGKWELTQGHVPSPEEIVARIDSVNADDIVRLAGQILSDDLLTLTAIGPVKKELKLS